jgi:hypothetical protein
MPDLAGMDEQTLIALLGAPQSQDGTPPGKHWYYRLKSCELSLSLFPSLPTGTYRLLSYKVSDNEHSDVPRDCQARFSERLYAREAGGDPDSSGR